MTEGLSYDLDIFPGCLAAFKGGPWISVFFSVPDESVAWVRGDAVLYEDDIVVVLSVYVLYSGRRYFVPVLSKLGRVWIDVTEISCEE